MKFSKLARIICVFNGKKKSGMLVILPIFHEYEFLQRDLRLLCRQTSQNFDVLVLMSGPTNTERAMGILENAKAGFRVIAAKRYEDTGSAGADFAGQTYALENRYDYMVLATAACAPVDRKLMEGLAKKKGNEVVLPKIRLIGPPGAPIQYSGTIPNYGLIPSKIVRQIGLIYAPFYNGGEEVEYLERLLKAGCRIDTIDCQVTQPNRHYKELPFLFIRPHFILHALLICKINIWVHITSLFEAAVFFEEPFRGKMRRLLRLALQFKYGREVAHSLRTDFERYMLRKESVPKDAAIINLGRGRSLVPIIRQFGYLYLLKNVFTIPFFYFRKNVIIRETNSYRLMALTSVFAKSLYYQSHDGRCLLVAKNESFLVHIMKILAFFLALPFALLIYTPIFMLMKKLKYPKTYGFGLPI